MKNLLDFKYNEVKELCERPMGLTFEGFSYIGT
jgi:hypothetical protein